MPGPSKMGPFGAIKLASIASAISALLFAFVGLAVTTRMSFDMSNITPVSDLPPETANLLMGLFGVLALAAAVVGFILPKVMLGKPTIRGTRVTVELILRKLAEGATEADLVEAYPQLTPEAIHAAMAYAADTLAHEELVFATA